MATDQAFSNGHGHPQGSLGWDLSPAGPPQGNLTEEQHRDSERDHMLFRAFQHSEDVDPLQSVATMSALLHRWLRPDVRTKKQILDKLLLETFMTCMPLELQVLVRKRCVQSCEELKVLLRNQEKLRKWKVVTFQGQKYLEENSDVQMADEEVGDTDQVLDLSMKSRSPISQMGVHPENSQEVHGEPWNQPGTSDVVWAQNCGPDTESVPSVPLHQELTFPGNMATNQAFSNGHAHSQDSLGWQLTPSGPPQGNLTDKQHQDSEREHVLFRAFKHSEDADPLQSVATMSALLHRWLRPDVHTKKQILDKLLLEKFMTCMPLELQVLVRERRVKRCQELKVLLRNKEKPRKWKVVTFQGQKYLEENSDVQMTDEEDGDTDQVLDLSLKSRSPIGQTGVQPENSQEVNGEPGNQPGTREMVWGQGQKVLPPVHTQEKPFECAVCHRRFGHRGNLNVHMRTHSGLRPYPCPHCHLAFRHLGTFKRHQRTHVQEAPQVPSDPEGKSRVSYGANMVNEHLDWGL